jgi:hypothetical protein|tara:strand:+ start:322 stop:627 length:306 start_codon:yes stop_codon:yes gene_type:complete
MEKNGVPEFKSEMEAVAWSLTQLSEAVKNLASRIAVLETAFNKLPPPGADMVKYKIPGDEDYSNLKELFDNLYERLNKLEEEHPTERYWSGTNGSIHTGDR